MLKAIRNILLRRNPRTGAAPTTDVGFALISVIGFGAVIVLSLLLVGTYTARAMKGARHAEDSSSAIEAAQAGVDDLVARLGTDPNYIAAGGSRSYGPVAISGATDVSGAPCTDGALLSPTCPQYSYVATRTGGTITVTSTGQSLGVRRSVQVTLKQPALTDYLYYSAVEAADPADGFAYPAGAPMNCKNPAWGTTPRPSSGCVVPTWRAGDGTTGSRVHTSDVFTAVGNPTFNSRVSAAIPSCASASTACVVGGNPTFQQGNPGYANDITLPTSPLGQIAAAGATSSGCTYSGPTRIEFLDSPNAGKMRVWSPQSTFATTAERDRCLGGPPPDLLGGALKLNVNVTSGNQSILAGLLGLPLGLLCSLLHVCIGGTASVSVSDILNKSLLDDLAQALPYTPNPVQIPSAIYVKDAPNGGTTLLQSVQCLLGSAAGLGLQAGDLQAGMNGLLGSVDCRAGNLYVSGKVKGKTTAGVTGAITIMSDLTYSDPANDRLGLVAVGPVQVYNSIQCLLAIGTCLSLDNFASGAISGLQTFLANPLSGDLTSLVNSLGINKSITVDAAILTSSRFGVQLPLLSLGVSANVLQRIVNLNISPPTLHLVGSVAQQYRGIIGANLLSLSVGLSPTFDLVSTNVDIGYRADLVYDNRLRTDPPPYFPAPATARWLQTSLAEVKPS